MTATNALCAILHQLFSQSPRLLKHAVESYHRNSDKLPGLFYSLWELLTTTAADPWAGEFVCVLDALDECQASERSILLETICDTFRKLASEGRGSMNLKFLVTSRLYHDIEAGFKRLTFDMPMVHLAGDGEEEVSLISREIELVIDAEVDSLGVELELEKSVQISMKRKLCQVTNRTYLWLKLILDVIRARVEGVTEKDLVEILRTIPATLDEAYEAILAKSPLPDRAKKILQIICAAVRPLSLNEMNIALHIESNNRKYEEIDLKPQGQFASIIRKICGLFVSVKDERVYLIHLTAKEFLMSNDVIGLSNITPSTIGRWKHSLIPAESNLALAKACIWYLQLEVFAIEQNQKWLERDEFKSCMESHAFLDYSAQNWPAHFKQAGTDQNEEILKTVFHICKLSSPGFRTWFPIHWNTIDRYNKVPNIDNILVLFSLLGLTEPLRLVLTRQSVFVNILDRCSQTPLAWAAKYGQTEVVRLLLATPRVVVDSAHHFFEDYYGHTPLALAAMEGHTEVVQLLLATSRVDINSRDENGQTPLSLAAEYGYIEVVKVILDTSDVDVNLGDRPYRRDRPTPSTPWLAADQRNRYSRTPLSWACLSGNWGIARILLAVPGLNPNPGGDDGKTPLMLMVLRGELDLARMLIAMPGVDVNLGDDRGRTALSYAAGAGNEEIVRMLLAVRSANVDLEDVAGMTALSYASENGHKKIVEMLLTAAKVNNDT
jgi:ankyrin repeat protein